MINPIRVQRSLLRPDELWGCERTLVLLLSMIVVVLTISVANLYTFIVGVVIWFVGFGTLRKMAKLDPDMSRVYMRHIRYRRYYPALAVVHSKPPEYRETGGFG